MDRRVQAPRCLTDGRASAGRNYVIYFQELHVFQLKFLNWKG